MVDVTQMHKFLRARICNGESNGAASKPAHKYTAGWANKKDQNLPHTKGKKYSLVTNTGFVGIPKYPFSCSNFQNIVFLSVKFKESGVGCVLKLKIHDQER